MVLTPSRVSGTVSVARFSEGPHLLLSAIYLIREPLLVYPSLSLFPFSVVAQPGKREPLEMLGISACFYENGLRLPAAHCRCMRGVGVPTPIAPFVPFRFVPIQATVNDAREGRTRVFFLSSPFFFFFFFFFSLPSKNLSVRTQIKVSKELR